MTASPLRFRPLALIALPIAFAACSAASEQVGVSGEALSATTTYLLPVEDDVREACRTTWTQQFCDAGGAQAAAQACVSALSTKPACASNPTGCFQLLTTATPCLANGPIYPDAASCNAPVAHTCAFYSACLETAEACGDSGYALGYGEKYCSRFDVDATFSPAGVAWRDAVLHCLQEALVPELPKASTVTCDAITTFAFDSHPRCYTEGPSICFLPLSDVTNVLGTIDGKDLLSLRSAKQMATVAGDCVLQFLGFRDHFEDAAVRGQLPVELQDREALGNRLQFWQDVQRRAQD